MKTRAQLSTDLSVDVASKLEKNIREEGRASLLVSGGSTPKDLFKQLSNMAIQWKDVDITLVDERFVEDSHPDQNGNLVKEHLLQNRASEANFIPLVHHIHDSHENLRAVRKSIAHLNKPFTVVLLGMGTDGHTASLFPDSEELKEAIKMDQSEDIMLVETASSPYQRITFTRKALLNSKHLILHCYGEEKKKILEQAKKEKDYLPYPIQAFLNLPANKLDIYWTN